MPQLDIYSFFAAATSVIISFLILLFMLHCYLLPRLARTLKLRSKYFRIGDIKQTNQKSVNVKNIIKKMLKENNLAELRDVKRLAQGNSSGLGLKIFRYASPKLVDSIQSK